jgi:hypothetical protein
MALMLQLLMLRKPTHKAGMDNSFILLGHTRIQKVSTIYGIEHFGAAG